MLCICRSLSTHTDFARASRVYDQPLCFRVILVTSCSITYLMVYGRVPEEEDALSAPLVERGPHRCH